MMRWLRSSLLPWVLFLAGWELVSWFSPVPSSVCILWLAAKDMTDPFIATALMGSLGRMTLGFSAVIGLGVGLGMLVGRFRALDSVFGTLAAALNAMPGAAWVPLAVVLLGLNQKAVIFTIVLGATGIVMLNTRLGIRDVPTLILRAAQTMGATGTRMFWHVTLPAAFPRIIDGLRLAWAFGWRALMAGELMIGSVHGMGQVINRAAKHRDIEQLLALMVIIAVIGMAVDGILFHQLIGGRIRTRWGTA
jgi:NitT/TauT family transport system permease protein